MQMFINDLRPKVVMPSLNLDMVFDNQMEFGKDLGSKMSGIHSDRIENVGEKIKKLHTKPLPKLRKHSAPS